MTLPASPPITAQQINVELGRASTAAFSITGAEERALAGVPSGAISFSDFLGKSNIEFDHIESQSDTDQSVVVSVGPAFTGRRLFFTIHWVGSSAVISQNLDGVTFAGNACTIHIQAQNRNTATNQTVGVAIVSIADTTNTSGTVSYTINAGSINFTRVGSFSAKNLVGAGPTDTDFDTTNDATAPTSTSVSIPSGGLWIAAATVNDDAPNNVSFTGPSTQAYKLNGRAARYQTFMSATTGVSTLDWPSGLDRGGAHVAMSWDME